MCVLVGIVLMVRSAIGFVDTIEDFERIEAPGTSSIDLEEGSYTVYAESDLFGRVAVTCGDLQIRGPGERMVELEPYSSSVTYTASGHHGFARCSFHADVTGTYRVITSTSSGTIAIGPGLGAGLIGGLLVGILLMVVGGLFALITIIVTAVRRGKARRRQMAAAYRPYPT